MQAASYEQTYSRVKYCIDLVEKASRCKYPVVQVLPYAIVDGKDQLVIHAAIGFPRRVNDYYAYVVHISTPAIQFLDWDDLIGITAHEFLHCVAVLQSLALPRSGNNSVSNMAAGNLHDGFFADPRLMFGEHYITKRVEETFTPEGRTRIANLIYQKWIAKGGEAKKFTDVLQALYQKDLHENFERVAADLLHSHEDLVNRLLIRTGGATDHSIN